jgi:predicted adenine nucleotide alpha hydrolase (AANH) superfamily ATPase
VTALRQEGGAVTLYWDNPNIHPYTEYRARRDALRAYAEMCDAPLVEAGEYGLRPFLAQVVDDVDHRCGVCYRLRMESAARYAAEAGFDAFTTSLLISPYQDHEGIRRAGEVAAEEHGVHFLYRDFRPLFRAGQQAARDMGLYMQKYCGCIFSEEERYRKKPKFTSRRL